MFTGIIEETGKIIEPNNSDGQSFRLACSFNVNEIDIGASICCDGICLTVSSKGKTQENTTWFEVDVSDETRNLTNINCEISPWIHSKEINLERSLKVGDELGGHIVTGHVDGIAKLKEINGGKNSYSLKISVPKNLTQYIAKKGSVTLNGTSLTVNEVGDDWLTINLIPHTIDITNWKGIKIGQQLNIEVDILARYVSQILHFKG